MSDEGKLFRGLKWYQYQRKDGSYPDGILNTEKAVDLNYYLEFVKGKDTAKVTELLKQLSLMGRTSKKKLPEYKRLLDELNSLGNKSSGKK